MGTPGANSGQFTTPSALAIDGDGLVYVADTGNGRIQVFTADGAFSFAFGARGQGAGLFKERLNIGPVIAPNISIIGAGQEETTLDADGEGSAIAVSQPSKCPDRGSHHY